MKQTLLCREALIDLASKLDRLEAYGYDGWGRLYDYFTELEDDIGQEIEADIIAICCEYTRYESLEEFKEAYPGMEDVKTLNDLAEHTTVIPIDEDEDWESEDPGPFIVHGF